MTSGGRSRFPADIPVGRVLDPGGGSDFQREIVVEPSASLENLSFLNVLLVTNERTFDPSVLLDPGERSR